MKNKILRTFFKQHDQSDCGVACLLSIINFYEGKSLETNIKLVFNNGHYPKKCVS
ncbi:cysteine peptidase family C39 domain-containing protein [Lutibacter sp.]|uniref:cysteine peptidase family C39 domain-containing protein n=1 Tax=Lutibacter sp. TaxID=1925666 RepID=UPI0034204AFF